MKVSFARLIGPVVLLAAVGYSTVQASPADTAPGTVTPSTATTAVPVAPMPAAAAAATTPGPVPPSAPAAQSPGAPAPAASDSRTAAPADTAAAPPVPKSAEEETLITRKTARVLGLKPHNKGGTEVYCKASAEIGTRMPTLNCYTKEQVMQLQKNTQSNQDDVAAMQRASLTEPNRN
jgi:hypothetical protein